MEYGTIKTVEITEEMRGAYLDYAMSVIVARALPDVRDGLKPVQRRIIYVMQQLGLSHTAPYKKSARIVGDTLGRYHPHGDAAVYDAMVRLAQGFSMRYPLVDGQGNFGSIDGDSPAAQRYTEARLTAIAEEMLQDIGQETVDFTDNFDGTLQEPQVLPSGLPNLLLNGAAGIAVGMATNIPPHNLNELCTAISLLIDNPDASAEDLMRVMPGPDFPTAGIILGQDGIRSAYSTGKGRFVVRARAHLEEATRGRQSVIVTELPYQVNKARLIERIADLVKQDRISDISDLRDESDRSGMRIVITLKREADPEQVLNQLFKHTQMQMTFGVNLLALVDGTQPRVLTLRRMLQHYITHRQEVIIRRTRHDLDRARQRSHVLEGLKIALDHLDEVIATIRGSPDAETAKANLMGRFNLTEVQAQAILDLQLRRLAALERRKIEEEYEQVQQLIAELEDILAHPRRVLELIQGDMRKLREKYGDARRTRIFTEEAGEIAAVDLVPGVEILVMLTAGGYVKRLAMESYRRQRRGGAHPAHTREEDPVSHVLVCSSKDDLLFFSKGGMAYQLKAHQLPDGERDPRGLPLSSLVSIDSSERIAGLAAVPDFEADAYLVMTTRLGKVKRTSLAEFRSVRSSGLAALALEDEDALVGVCLTQGEEDILVATTTGQVIRFPQETVRPMGRSAAGVKAVTLRAKDAVAAVDICPWPQAELMTVSSSGYGKRSPLSEYPVQGRGGKGVIGVRIGKGEQLAAARVVQPGEELAIVSVQGRVLRMPVDAVPRLGRATRGDSLVDLGEQDQVHALTVLRDEELLAISVASGPEAAPPAPEESRSPPRTTPPAAPTTGEKVEDTPAETTTRRRATRGRGEEPSAGATVPARSSRKKAAPKPAPSRERPRQGEEPSAEAEAAAPTRSSRKKAAPKPAPSRRRPRQSEEPPEAGATTPVSRKKAAPKPAPRQRRPPQAQAEETPPAAIRQMAFTDVIPPPAEEPPPPEADAADAEEDYPPLVIKHMGRVIYSEPAAEGAATSKRRREGSASTPPAQPGQETPSASPSAERMDVGISPILSRSVPAKPPPSRKEPTPKGPAGRRGTKEEADG